MTGLPNYDSLKYYCPKCNTECAGICPTCGYSDHNPTMYKKEAHCTNHKWFELSHKIINKNIRVCTLCCLYQYRNDLSIIWKDFNEL